MNLSQFYINGKWVDPVKPETLDVINPATEESVGQISVGSEQDVNNAVTAARQAFKSFSENFCK
jgi:aldehyde dehydrogenase (NAD+)